MNFSKLCALAVSVAVLASAQVVAAHAQVQAETDKDKTLYTFGYAMAQNLRSFGFSEAEVEIITQGIADTTLNRKPQVELNKWTSKIPPLLDEKRRAAQRVIIARQTAASAKLLAKEAKTPGAKKLPSGIIMTVLKPGTGRSPEANSKVTVHYHGTLGDGTVFDSSRDRGEPATFQLNGVIKCWTEGLQTMKLGGKSRLVCPAELAYGDRGAGESIPPATALIFEVELLKID